MSEEKWDTEANQLRKAAEQAGPEGLKRVDELLSLGTPVDQATAETSAVVVCSTDNPYVIGQQEIPCADCGKTVYVSPSSPRNPPKICIECCLIRLEKESK